MLVTRARELSPCSSSTLTLTSSRTFLSTLCSSNPFLSFPMRSSLSFLRSLSHHQPHLFHRHFFFRAISTPLSSSSPKPQKPFPLLAAASASSSHSTFVSNSRRANPKPMRIGILITVVRARQVLILIRMMGIWIWNICRRCLWMWRSWKSYRSSGGGRSWRGFVRNCRHIRPEHLFGYSMRKRSGWGKLMLLMLPCIACGFARMRPGLRWISQLYVCHFGVEFIADLC